METDAVDNYLRVAERLGLPAALIFAGLFMLWRLVGAVGPAASKLGAAGAAFLDGLTSKLESHTVDHAKLDGKLDAHTEKVTGKLETHHARTASEIRQSTASIRSAVDSMRAELVRSVDAAADRILDNVLRTGGPESSTTGTTPTGTPVEGIPRTSRHRREDIAAEDTKESP